MSGLRKFQFAEESLYFHLSLLQTKQMTAHHLSMYPSNKNRLNEANKRLKKEEKDDEHPGYVLRSAYISNSRDRVSNQSQELPRKVNFENKQRYN